MWWSDIGKFAVRIVGLWVVAEGPITIVLAVPVAILILVIAYRLASQ